MPNAARPLVSVLTPSYNYGRFIGACLDSVRTQRYPAIEHLVMDACSTDDTAAVLARHQRPGLDVRIEKDQGQADALERGFARAHGDIFCWLNADDYYLHEDVVAQAVDALADADVVTAGGWYVDRDGGRRERIVARPDRTAAELRYYDTILQPATFWRRSVHQSIRRDLHFAFDWQLFLDMQRAGARFRVVPTEWAAYRMHDINKTASDPAARRGEIAAILAAQFGPLSPQHLWAATVHRGYMVADALQVPQLKRALRFANAAAFHLTRRRVFSC